METGKKIYTSPKLTVHGDIEEITQGFSTGEYTDADFPIHTKLGDVTFS